jgi:hypothetical protein
VFEGKGVDPVRQLIAGLGDGGGMGNGRGAVPVGVVAVEIPDEEEGEGRVSGMGRLDVAGQRLEAGKGIAIAISGVGLEVHGGEEERATTVRLDDCAEDSGGWRGVGGEGGLDGMGVCGEELHGTVGVVEEGNTSTTLADLIDGGRARLVETGPVGGTGIGWVVTRLYHHVEEWGGGGVEVRGAVQHLPGGEEPGRHLSGVQVDEGERGGRDVIH